MEEEDSSPTPRLFLENHFEKKNKSPDYTRASSKKKILNSLNVRPKTKPLAAPMAWYAKLQGHT
jgi:hypothetical protein